MTRGVKSMGSWSLRGEPRARERPTERELRFFLAAIDDDPELIRIGAILGGLSYPVVHLLAPPGAVDPWAPWWLAGGALALVGVLPAWSGFFARHFPHLFYACLAIIAAHFLLLSHLNAMQPFYALGAFFGVVIHASVIRSRGGFLAYSAFVGSLTVVLIALGPQPLKFAYWWTLWVILCLGYFRLSAQIRTADLLQRHQCELEDRVAERTRELSAQAVALERSNERLMEQMRERERLEEQLWTTQKMDALGRLAGGVAHDYNNFLTAILGFTEVLQLDIGNDDRRRRDLDEIHRAASQAVSLTQSLLAFGRGGVVESRSLDLAAVVREMQPMLHKLLGEDVALRLRLCEEPALVCLNRSQLEQVILNLVLNARDALVKGGCVTIEAVAFDRRDAGSEAAIEGLAGDRFVRLAVADTGIGMDSETRAHAFDPFFTTKSVGDGTGLGLAIVYGIVDRSGGRVRILSAPGSGSRFEIHWPIADGARAPCPEQSREPPRLAGREHVLVVEDRGDVRRFAHRILASHGYEVLDAADAASALRVFESADPRIDLVLTDVVMPDMSGLELAERLRAADPAPKVVFISGYLNHPSLRSGRIPPEIRLLAKPFTAGELAGTVRSVLDGG